MTYAELQARMSSTELELWYGYAMLKQDECPNCGVEPRDMMEYATVEVKCPVCKHQHARVRRHDEKMGLR